VLELTIFDDAGHDSWTRVYDNREIYDWMFEQIKKNLVNEKYNTATFKAFQFLAKKKQ
jgi:hypothetical protein